MEISITDDLMALREPWKLLWSRAGHPHMSYEWHLLWNRHLRGASRPVFIVARDGRDVKGIAPLVLDTVPAALSGVLKLRRLTFHGLHFVDAMDFLTDGDPETLQALCQAAIGLRDWDVCELRRLQSCSVTIPALSDASSAKAIAADTQVLGVSPYLPLEGDFDSYYASIGKEWRTQGERKLRKMEREAGGCRLEIITQPSLDLLFELRDLATKRRAAGDMRRCPLLDELRYQFLVDLLPEFTSLGWWRIAILRAGKALAAYQICFAVNGVAYLWSLAHHPEYETYSPGKLLLRLHLEACYKEGFKEFDFMAGDESYKGHWTKLERQQSGIQLTRPTWRLHLVRMLSTARNPAKDNQ
jgi:CelD/BcsL family acetyltransferase involved in cellulose biosynthesis